MTEERANPEQPVTLGRVLGRLSHELSGEGIGTGSLAELRRMTPSDRPPVFWRLYLRIVPEEWREPGGHADLRVDAAWAGLIRAMAEMAPKPLDFDRSFGSELAKAGYSEFRFVRLVRAEDGELARELRVAAEWLARKHVKANLHPVAELLLGRPWLGLDVRPDRAVRTLSHDFFRAQAAQS